MRGVFILVVIVVILVGAGVLSITWGDGTATVKFNKEKAKERGEQVLDEARALEAKLNNRTSQSK